jgi:molecular chaperone GrpE
MSDALEAPETVRRLDELTDLFRRRLVEDREKQRAFEALYQELAQARAIADGEYLMPLIRRLIGVIDRLGRASGEVAQSVVEELADVLASYDVERTRPSSAAFDPLIQEIASVLETTDPDQDGTVALVHRDGWVRGGRVLRPMLVDVRRLRTPDETPAAEPAPRGDDGSSR